ncbi:MAG TPA: methylmalonyl Co-A mutase-associated GTPase MeaB, partial [Desulfobulbus sp.]|nr:methylmalonyl Co-A mutase-associated GTPase MeaB [Desulfobulbus sp.]
MVVDSLVDRLQRGDARSVARAITLVEEGSTEGTTLLERLDRQRIGQALVVGMTGPPGAGKSTLCGQLIGQLRDRDLRVGIIAIDPSSPLTGGAILGDRVRMMRHALDPGVMVRSMATRGRLGGLCSAAGAAVRIMAASGCRVVLLETVGVGQ